MKRKCFSVEHVVVVTPGLPEEVRAVGNWTFESLILHRVARRLAFSLTSWGMY